MTMAPYNNAPETGTRNGRSADRGAGAGALVFGALFVGVIAVCALFIAYEGIYRLAAIVHADSALPLAHVFPVTFTLLVLMAFWVSYTLRAAPPSERLWIDIGLIPLLILSAAVPMVLTRTTWFSELGDTLPRGLTVVVAVAPLAALLVAFLLWIAVRAHVRRRNAQARPRPKPSDDRTTVLRGASKPRPEPQEEAPEALQTRLLRLGGEPEVGDAPEASEEPAEADPRIDAAQTSGPEAPTEPIPRREEEEEAEEPDEELTATSSAGVETPEPDLSEPEPSVPTVRLPRRTRSGDNPIKRAATEAPVVPGAAAPEPEPWDVDDTEDFHPVTWEASADERHEGFMHEPDVGDPSSDEAEAPRLMPVATDSDEQNEWDEPDEESTGTESTGEESEADDPVPATTAERVKKLPGVRLFFPEHTDEAPETEAPQTAKPAASPEPEATTEPAPEPPIDPIESVPAEAEPVPEDELVPGDEPEPDARDEPSDEDTPLWEPPTDDSAPSSLNDYVPPVWTPPEDDTSAEQDPLPSLDAVAKRTGAATDLALDHDTGPEVRAAFRLGSMPPGAARPEPAPEPDLDSVEEPTAEEIDRAPEPVPEAEPSAEPERPAPRSRREEAMRKRPMVLKPPRPPMPDFASGPPSRRVRSEPLPPEEY